MKRLQNKILPVANKFILQNALSRLPNGSSEVQGGKEVMSSKEIDLTPKAWQFLDELGIQLQFKDKDESRIGEEFILKGTNEDCENGEYQFRIAGKQITKIQGYYVKGYSKPKSYDNDSAFGTAVIEIRYIDLNGKASKTYLHIYSDLVRQTAHDGSVSDKVVYLKKD